MAVENEDLIDRVMSEWLAEEPGLDTSGLAIVGRITNLADRYRKQTSQRLERFDLQYSEFDVLATLRRSGEPYQLTPTKLMQSVLLTSGAITATTNRLLGKKLVRRVADPNDGRVKSVALTSSGKRLIDKAAAMRFQIAQDSISTLTKKESEQAVKLLRKLTFVAESDQ